ncbi:MAG TPA: SET domain-containing protein-lysine N-methyltransferase [Candidatus Acidoferrum sp.]|nr:SET domain-containing protein-lysine N-methyltransferase [Candidatus Acidoferrum sp.]
MPPPRRGRANAGTKTGLEVRTSSIQGVGVFARRPIAAGTRVIEYTGEVISEREGDARYDDRAMARHHTYLMALDDGRCIDAGVGGNEARFINHSCEPNCETVEEDGRVWIQAIRPIAVGEELTYDYRYERSEGDDESFYRCGCGATTCRGTILLPREAPAGGTEPIGEESAR